MEMYRLMNAGPWTIYRGPRKPADKPAQEQITERDAGVRTVRELRALQPSPRALRPFPCQPQAVAACRSPQRLAAKKSQLATHGAAQASQCWNYVRDRQ